tara:strand:- start:3246 stop:3692 length:447 start_codon:yes stop_codon:yes gene_type:complete
MFEPASLPYYIALFGTPILSTVLMGTLGLFIGLIYRKGSRKHLAISAALAFGLFAAIFANPIVSLILFVPGSNARVAEMYEAANKENFSGSQVDEFTQRFGKPDEVRQGAGLEGDLLVYTCRPWFAYGWDELAVYTENNHITGILIDD